eukprot:13203658-Heterocapsa_arctica.AAC.1
MSATAGSRSCSKGSSTLHWCEWRSVLVSYASDAFAPGMTSGGRHGRRPLPRGPVGVRGGS